MMEKIRICQEQLKHEANMNLCSMEEENVQKQANASCYTTLQMWNRFATFFPSEAQNFIPTPSNTV